MADTSPGKCNRCGIYALLRQDYPYCTTCLAILAEGSHYLFTVGAGPAPAAVGLRAGVAAEGPGRIAALLKPLNDLI